MPIYQGGYDTTEFIGCVWSDRSLSIALMSDDCRGKVSNEIWISAAKARRIVADLEAIESQMYGDSANEVTHFLLSRTYAHACAEARAKKRARVKKR